jgi:glycosyltransferase involved in cell wall biosynthesis
VVLTEDRLTLRERFDLPNDRTLVYVGKAVHWKGTDLVCRLLAEHRDLYLVSTGNNTIGVPTHHTGFLPYLDHLRAIRACDVGLFLPRMHEGWSRCAAEAILLGLPCITNEIAGLGDLARQTGQPAADLSNLADQVRERARTPPAVTARARLILAEHGSTDVFARRWRSLVDSVTGAGTPSEPFVKGTPDH